MTTNWKSVLGIPDKRRRPTFVDYVGLIGGILPVLAVFWVLLEYEVPEWIAVPIALGWAFPSIFIGSRVSAVRSGKNGPSV